MRDIERVSELYRRLAPCTLCPHHCGVDRRGGKAGRCGAGSGISVASCNLHFGEEPPISGERGSGTIFFAHCPLRCVFCQNYPLSQLGHGNAVTIEQLTDMLLDLQGRGAHNINFVTPTHMAAHMADAVVRARAKGLAIPIVYNTSGYDDVATLRLLDGIVDIYLPDAKYMDDAVAIKLSGARNYHEVNTAALKEMHRQVGALELDEHGIARRGMIIRHLVLPGGLSQSSDVLRFIARDISPDVHVSLMAQYHPAHRAESVPGLEKRLTQKEYDAVLRVMEEAGLGNGWQQEL